MYSLIEDSWISVSAYTFNLLSYLLWLKYMEKISLLITQVHHFLKRGVFPFQTIVDILLWYSKTWKQQFLQAQLQCGFLNQVNDLFLFCCTQIIDSSCSLSGSFTHVFYNSMPHLENTGSLNYAVLPNIDLVHYKY